MGLLSPMGTPMGSLRLLWHLYGCPIPGLLGRLLWESTLMLLPYVDIPCSSAHQADNIFSGHPVPSLMLSVIRCCPSDFCPSLYPPLLLTARWSRYRKTNKRPPLGGMFDALNKRCKLGDLTNYISYASNLQNVIRSIPAMTVF